MGSEPGQLGAFLGTSVLFAAVLSDTGGARLILKLGEAGVVRLWVGQRVLQEADGVLARKSPESKGLFALLLDRGRVEVAPVPGKRAAETARALVGYAPDAHVLAEALAARVDYFVTLDRQHFVGKLQPSDLPLPVGTPGDFLAWLRERLSGAGL